MGYILSPQSEAHEIDDMRAMRIGKFNPAFFAFALVMAALFGLAHQVEAKERASIHVSAVEYDGRAYLVSFSLNGAFTEDMERAILAGIPTTFTYFFKIQHDVSVLADETIHAFQIVRTVRYDSIRQSFSIFLGEKGSVTTAKTLSEAKAIMAIFNSIEIHVPIAPSSGEGYYLMIRAQMEKVELPPAISRLFNFFFQSFLSSLWRFETQWTRIDLPAPQPGAIPGKGTAP
jgi:Domain of unknown function (DUF4390)